MVRQKQQASSPPPEDENLEPQPLHPVLRHATQVDDLLGRSAARKEQQEFQIKEVELWKECVNAIAASPNGKMFLQNMIKFSGRNDPANIRDTMKMVDAAIKSAFYLTWVRPFINPDLRSAIE